MKPQMAQMTRMGGRGRGAGWSMVEVTQAILVQGAKFRHVVTTHKLLTI